MEILTELHGNTYRNSGGGAPWGAISFELPHESNACIVKTLFKP